MINKITKDVLDKGFSFSEYKELIDRLLSEGKTTGSNQSKDLVEYTRLNVTRMNRILKTTVINDELKNELNLLNKNWIWLVISEAWCGDVANIVPVIYKISELNRNINLKIILRDENPDIMNNYLTNGAKSIPILICLNADSLEEIGKWGPRPKQLQNLVLNLKKSKDFNINELKKTIQIWYANDKTQSIQKELFEKINEWKKY